MNLLAWPVRSSLGKKYLMAVTGLLLVLFVLGHMSGNLLIYAGRDALNTYAAALKHRPALLWTARIGLLVVFVLHVYLGLKLTQENYAARGSRYVHESTMQASWASRHMLLTGVVLLAFVVYHLAHFTFGVVKPARVQSTPSGLVELDPPKDYLDLAEVLEGGKYVPDPEVDLRSYRQTEGARQDVYSMVIAGFRNPWVTLSYLVAMAFLGLHLWHGGSSFLQSLGLAGIGKGGPARALGPVLAVVVVTGNCSIPLAVWLDIVK
jgi:succinate dehydrogenase / fumarate reductase cytochrome b subunit